MKRILLAAMVAVMAMGTSLLAKDAASERAQAIVDKAIDYLKGQQQADGGWQAGSQPPAITAVVLKAIVQDEKYNADTEFVKKGYDKLLTFQWENGGIYRDLLANYNTAIAISSLAAAEKPEFKARIDKAVAYLKSLQWNDRIEGGPKGEKNIDVGNPWYGGAGYSRAGRPDGSNTQIMVDALHDAGLAKEDPAFKAAVKFMSRLQNFSETNDQKWAGNDGGAIYSPANNGESQAGEYKGPNGERMLRSYGSMTYGMLKTYVYAGLSKDDPRVKAAWDWISKNWTLDENPGMRANDPDMAQNGMYYYYLTLSRALNAYDQPIIIDPQGNKHDWRVELINKLQTLQKPDGSFAGEKRWMEDNPSLISAFVILSLQEAMADLKEHPAE